MHLHPAIRAYFDADERNDRPPLHVFAPHAVVKDERRSFAGHEAIDAWWRETKEEYRAVARPLDADADADVVAVRAHVSGEFPGSPLTLRFAFRLENELITELEIGS